jgi:hypothetical protein
MLIHVPPSSTSTFLNDFAENLDIAQFISLGKQDIDLQTRTEKCIFGGVDEETRLSYH